MSPIMPLYFSGSAMAKSLPVESNRLKLEVSKFLNSVCAA